jgi:hypothetical protein
MASDWKPTTMRPDAIMPVTKYWVNFTPSPRSPLKIEPKMTMSMTGKTRREHDRLAAAQELLDLHPVWRRPRTSEVGQGRVVMPVPPAVAADHLEVDVLQRRAG